ncbi:HTH-type transcriptional activator RhaS [compost metagenome]
MRQETEWEHEFTQSSGVVALLVEVLEIRGLHSTSMLREAGIDPGWLSQPDIRIPARCSDRLWQMAVEATDDECLALDFAERFRPGDLQVLNFGLYASLTLRDASERLVRAAHILSQAPRYSCEVRDARFEVCIEPGYPGASPHRLLACQASFLKVWRSLAGPELVPCEVRLQQAPPRCAEAARRIEAFFGCPPVYGAACSGISLELSQAQVPLANGDAELARSGDEIVERYLARTDACALTPALRDVVVRQIASGLFDQEAVAQRLGLSVRTLQRRLAEEGAAFKDLLCEARRRLAERYLLEGRHSIKEVAYLLGFADLSNFARAFRGWYAMTPREFQQRRKATANTPQMLPQRMAAAANS